MSRLRLLATRVVDRLDLTRLARVRIVAADLADAITENAALEQQLAARLDAVEAAVGQVAHTWQQARQQADRPEPG